MEIKEVKIEEYILELIDKLNKVNACRVELFNQRGEHYA